MTSEEIKKALNTCTFGYCKETRCKDCPFDSDKEPCITNLHLSALEYIRRIEAENAALRERLGKWAVDNEIVMEPRVKDGQTYYVISRKERRIVTHYICTELTLEAAEKRLAELGGEK